MFLHLLRFFPLFFAFAWAIAPSDIFAQTQVPTPFAQIVNQHFSQWDKNGDGKLSKDEIDAAVTNPDLHNEEAAAIAAIKLVVRGGKYTLPDITQDYLVASPLREKAMTATNISAETLDDPAQPKQTGAVPAFQPRYRSALGRMHRVSRELFPQGQLALDACRQGPLGDCYFVSVVGAMLYRNPADIKAMFTTNEDGSTTVAFGKGHRIKVPPLTDAEIAISSTAGTNGLWLTILENAYGKFRQSTARTNDTEDAPDTDVISHGGKPGYVISALDGRQTKIFTLILSKGQHHTAQFPTNLLADLRDALQDHRLAAACTPTNALPPGINHKHAYAILGYNPDAATVRLWNPHGNNFKPKGPDGPQNGYTTKAGQFDIPVKDLLAIYRSVVIETPAPSLAQVENSLDEPKEVVQSCFQLTITSKTNTYTVGTKIPITMVLSNISTNDLQIMCTDSRQYFTVQDESGKGIWPEFPFFDGVSATWLVDIKAHHAYEYVAELNSDGAGNAYLKPGIYKIRTKQKGVFFATKNIAVGRGVNQSEVQSNILTIKVVSP